ncbi:Strictosidine synthase, conserved region [Dillenia turbinata]|uniref:Strictosidine synthase, conserved region n=1 Tax=Dillenia turbinata TaxID=194707 RepID=A0AAN8W5M0_9MAGN
MSEHICGRPLGLAFNKMSGHLYIADAYLGLHMVGPEGGQATKLVTQAQGISFKFINGLDIDQNSGDVYFSESSSYFHRRNYILLSVSGDKSGRLLKYDPKGKQVTVLVENLRYPNGVALSKDSNYILIAETPNCRILKFWLKTSRAGILEVFAQIPGFPDNIKRNLKGEFWVGIYSRRGRFAKWIISNPWFGKFLFKLPVDPMRLQSVLTNWGGSGLAVKMNEEGNIVKILEDKSRKTWRSISEVEERNGTLWIGSITEPYAGMCNTSLG